MTDRTCSVNDCDKKVVARGWCSGHYQRWAAHGDPLGSLSRRRAKPPCSIDGCENPANARGLCGKHYQEARRADRLPDLPSRPTACVVDECGQRIYGHGLCGPHYTRWRIHGDVRGHEGLPPVGSRPPFGTKWCGKCQSYLPLSEFYVGKNKKRRESPCKACREIRDKKYRKANPPPSRVSGNRRRRARLRSVRSELYTALEIAERDGWRCGICGKRIGKTYKYPHRRSLSIDHIIPIRHGGDDVKLNVQAAHFSCNASKGHRGVDQLRLIG